MCADNEGPRGSAANEPKEVRWLLALAIAAVLLLVGFYGISLIAPDEISLDPFTIEVGR